MPAKKPARPANRPSADIDLKEVEVLAANGLKQYEIAAALGISQRTHFNRKADSEDYALAIERGRAKGTAKVANHLMKAIEGGNVKAMVFYLQSIGGWKPATATELSNPDGTLAAPAQVCIYLPDNGRGPAGGGA